MLYAKRNKLYSFEEEASHLKSENCTHTHAPPPPRPPTSANICQNEQILFVGSTIKYESNQPNFKLDRTTSFFGVVLLEKSCPAYR